MTVSGSYQEGPIGAVAPATAASFLRGRWRVRRRIVDHLAGVEGEFLGRAEFSPELAYREEGELTFGGHRGPATRALQYVDLGGHVLDVKFADGRDFYRLDLGVSDHWTAEHPCRADTYVVRGRITGPDSYTEHWHATGPAKDYELITNFERNRS